MISNAYAQAAAGPMGGGYEFIIMIGLTFALMYFMVIRPQTRRTKEQKQMIDALQKGDEVVALGIVGRIVKVGESYIGLEIAKDTVIHVQKQAVTTLLPKGTFNDVSK